MRPVKAFLEANPVSRRAGPVAAADLARMTAAGAPAEVIELLRDQGLTFYARDFLATTLPHWHEAALIAAKQKPKDCFPLLRTALGSLIFLKKGKVSVLDPFTGKVENLGKDLDFFLGAWMQMESLRDAVLDQDVYTKLADGRAVLAIDEYFVVEPTPQGAYKVAMGIVGDGPLAKYTVRVAKLGAPAPAKPGKATATKAPKVEDAAAGIVDPNLRLAVLEALIALGSFHLVPGSSRSGKLDRKLHRAYLKQPMTHEQLAGVKKLVWGGGMHIQHSIWPDWDGECETFDIKDWSGIEALPNLRDIRVVSAMVATDFTPLAGLPKLKTLKLPVVPPDDAAVKALKKRGVAVSA